MTNLKRISSVLLALLLLSTTATQAFAAPAKTEQLFIVMFHNRTGAAVTITLTGPSNLTLHLIERTTDVKMTSGTYHYSYTACGRKFSGTIKVHKDHTLLILWPCASQVTDVGNNTVNLVIRNQTGGNLNFTFSGPQNYRYMAPPGKSTLSLIPGKYTYIVTGSGCGSYEEENGKITIKTGYSWNWYCNK